MVRVCACQGRRGGTVKRWWYSGSIGAFQALDPGSIPGQRNSFGFFCVFLQGFPYSKKFVKYPLLLCTATCQKPVARCKVGLVIEGVRG